MKLRNEDEKNTTCSDIVNGTAQKDGDTREGNTRSKVEKQRSRWRSLSLPTRKTLPFKDERSNSTTDLLWTPQSKLTLSISRFPLKQRTAMICTNNYVIFKTRFSYTPTEKCMSAMNDVLSGLFSELGWKILTRCLEHIPLYLPPFSIGSAMDPIECKLMLNPQMVQVPMPLL